MFFYNKFIKAYNNEDKLKKKALNTTDSKKKIILHHFGALDNNHRIIISFERFYCSKIKVSLFKYFTLLLSLIRIIFDFRNIRNRITKQEEVIAEVI